MKILLDTSIFIDFLRGRAPARELLSGLRNEEMLYSAVTEAEILSGRSCGTVKGRAAAENLLSIGTKVPVNNAIAAMAGDLRRKHDVPLDDAFIAATSIVWEATLLSRNVEHFRRIPGLDFRCPY